MRATLVARSDSAATIRLTPSWLGWLFGARACTVDLTWAVSGKGDQERRGWLLAGSRRWLVDIGTAERARLQHALDRMPVSQIPRAVAKTTRGGGR